MNQIDETAAFEAAILNAAWMVRHYDRGGRTSIARAERDKAIKHLGEVIRDAFAASSNYEPLMIAFYSGLRPKDPPPF